MFTCDFLVKLYLEYFYTSENGRSRPVSCIHFYLFSSSCCVIAVLLSVFSILSCPVNCSALVSDVSAYSFFVDALWNFSGRLFITYCSKTIFSSFHIFWQSDCICQNICIASELSVSSSKSKSCGSLSYSWREYLICWVGRWESTEGEGNKGNFLYCS